MFFYQFIAAIGIFQVVNGVHKGLDPLVLKHKFGVSHEDKVQPYTLSKPTRTNQGSGFFYEVLLDDVAEKFWIEPKSDVISEGYHIVHREEDNSTVSLVPGDQHCVYQGHSITDNGTVIALAGCGRDMHGLVITSSGEHFLIQPHHQESDLHIIRKRRTSDDDHTCLFNKSDDPYPEPIRTKSHLVEEEDTHQRVKRIAVSRSEEMTIELAVFADDALWRHFVQIYGIQAADAELHKFIIAAVNNIDILYAQRSIQPKMRVKLVRYEVLKTPPRTLLANSHASGDVDRLLDAFCDFQHQINPRSDSDPRHWDHALLFSGYDLYRDGLYTVAGYAPVKGMCSGSRSCTINEGLDFGSVFVVTHEMGHSLGMYHDGDNECDLRCCIMSPSIGSGKTSWSQCSVREMRTFLQRLGNEVRPQNCLRDSAMTSEQRTYNIQVDPGQTFPLDEQCEIFHGQCWRHELKDGQRLQDVCSMVWCGNGEGVIRTAHPALEGTYCGPGKVCRSGFCVRSTRFLPAISGGWSRWDDTPPKACGGICSPCFIQNQIRLRRNTRRCNSPSTNNGGIPCRGDDAKGLVCSPQLCSGLSITDYAARQCRLLRDDPEMPNPQLTGEGIQFEQAPCKVWCLLSRSNNIRTVSNFPDGTPCGFGKYCIKGECRPLVCNGSVVAEYEHDCPRIIHTQKPAPYKEQKKSTTTTSAPLGQWSGWSEWSSCFTSACGVNGVRVRARRCLTTAKCVGVERQKLVCRTPCPENVTPKPAPTSTAATVVVTQERVVWSPWSGCSVSCGVGKRRRLKRNCTSDCTEIEECFKPPCSTFAATNSFSSTIAPTTTARFAMASSQPTFNSIPTRNTAVQTDSWSTWGVWSSCSKTCGQGMQTRRRLCRSAKCSGGDSQARTCLMPACTDVWSLWSSWSTCSASCGQGMRYRKRKCMMQPCTGPASEAEPCTGLNCPGRRPRHLATQRQTIYRVTSEERRANRLMSVNDPRRVRFLQAESRASRLMASSPAA